jgi:hypothetical protein
VWVKCHAIEDASTQFHPWLRNILEAPRLRWQLG